MELSERETTVGGAQLQPVATATTVRVRDGETLTTDGPFAEMKESIGGYYLLEAESLDDAIEVAATIPAARNGGAVDPPPGGALTEDVFRERMGPRVANLVGFLGDFDLAEDAAQEAFAIAAEHWPRDGMPVQPGRLDDDDGAEPGDRPYPPRANVREKAHLVAGPEAVEDEVEEARFRGRAARAAVHVLPPRARTRRAGRADPAHPRRPPTDEIARGSSCRSRRWRNGSSARSTRSKPRHPVSRAAGAPLARAADGRARRRLPDLQRGLRRPPRPRRRRDPTRLGTRRAHARRGRGARAARADAAPRRTPRRALRGRRAGAARRPGPLALRRAKIAAGRESLGRALALRGRGPYVLQAAIASLHADEPTDWREIAALYAELARVTRRRSSS